MRSLAALRISIERHYAISLECYLTHFFSQFSLSFTSNICVDFVESTSTLADDAIKEIVK